MRDSGVVVRPAGSHDLRAVTRIYAHYVLNTVVTLEEDPPTLGDWRRRAEGACAQGLPFLVAEDAGEVTGFAYCKPWRSRSAYRHTVEDSVFVAAGAARRGAGRRLLRGLLTDSAATGMRQMVAVVVETGDPASAALHRSCGFDEVGRLSAVGLKHGRWLDTLLLQRSLP
ncbi:N-acetyltransferase family protein [Actinomadura sp. KC216]|nr:N-acetyltransferase family protein [Actinomadura sp. KC216]